MKADMDNLHTIFLLKKNVRQDIIKTILGYPPIIALETLKEWKVAIISVRQGYKSIKEQLEATVTDLNRIDIFLGHDWLVKHNPEVN